MDPSTLHTVVLDSLEDQIAVINRQGGIVYVNRAWVKFATENGHPPWYTWLGVNYLSCCDNSKTNGDYIAGETAQGIRDVLTGKLGTFCCEYPCHSITENRWFLMRVSPLADNFQDLFILSHHNITKRKTKEDELTESESRWKFAIDGAGDGVWDVNIQTGEATYSRLWEEMLGYSNEDIAPSSQEWFTRIHPDDKQYVMDAIKDYLDGQSEYYAVEHRIKCKDDSYKWILSRGMAIGRNDDGMPLRMIGTHKDISERKRTEELLRSSEEKHRILFMESPDAYLILVDGIFVDCNRAAEVMLRGDRSQIVGHPPDVLSPEFQPDGKKSSEAAKEIISDALQTSNKTFEWLHRRLDGEDFYVEVSLALIELSGKQALFVAWRDISERKRIEKALEETNRKLETLSITDSLTGIANRRHFDEVLTKEYFRHARSGRELSLIMLDIDHFKAFNDNYGHVKGDDCLQQVAKVIADYSNRAADLAARYGGEEFVCILPDTDLDGAVIIAEKIRQGIQALAIPHTGSSIADCVTASFGVVTLECISDGSPIDIVTKADELLYKAKTLGRNRIEYNGKPKQRGTNLLQLVWQDSFCSGNQLIDTQHQSLLHDSNKLLKAIIELRKKDEISSLATRLLSDVAQHFRDEEDILKTIAYPDLKQHTLEHANLLNKAVKLAQEFESDTLHIGEVFEFLVYDMVQQHMLGADRKFFAYTGKP